MRIGVIGSGHIGATVARRLVEQGHEVAISNSRGPDSLRDLAPGLGARAATVEDAAQFGEVVIEAVPLVAAVEDLPADALEGKIVVDAANYYPGRDGTIEPIERGAASTQVVADRLDHSRVVKAFNTLNWRIIRDEHKPTGDPERLAMPVAGDDEEAKRVVYGLVDEVGFDPVDGGTLADSKRQEPGTPVYGAELDADGARDALASAA
jgi:8-hydroxy-5-deazaflavin:NADPH oxidoreductase